MRLSPSGGHKIASWTMLATSAGWAILAVILICIPCNPAQFYTSKADNCGDMVRSVMHLVPGSAVLTCTLAVAQMASYHRPRYLYRGSHLWYRNPACMDTPYAMEGQGSCRLRVLRTTTRHHACGHSTLLLPPSDLRHECHVCKQLLSRCQPVADELCHHLPYHHRHGSFFTPFQQGSDDELRSETVRKEWQRYRISVRRVSAVELSNESARP